LRPGTRISIVLPVMRATGLTILLVAVSIWLVIPHPFDFHRSFLENPGDPSLYVATWRWQWYSLTQGYIQQFWQGWFYYPNRWVMGYTEHILGLMPLFKLFEWIFGSAPAASTSVIISLFVFDGWAGYVMGRRIGRSYGAGLVGAVVTSFSTFHFNQIAHMHVSAYFCVPLALVALESLLKRPSWRRAVGLGALWGVTPLFSYSNWAVIAVALVPFSLVWLAVNRRANERRSVGAAGSGDKRKDAEASPPSLVKTAKLLALSSAVCVTLVVPMSIQFFKARSEVSIQRSTEEIAAHSVQMSNLLQPSDRSIAYRYLPAPAGKNNKIETISYLGLAGVFFGIAGYFWPAGAIVIRALNSRRKSNPRAPEEPNPPGADLLDSDRELVISQTPWFAAAVTGFVLMLGPEVRIRGSWPAIPGPYRLLMAIPGFSQLRAAGRFSLLVFLFAAVAAAASWRRFSLRSRFLGPLAVAAFCALWIFEGAIAVGHTTPLPADAREAPDYVHWLAAAEHGPTVVLPIYTPGVPSSSEAEAMRLYVSTFDWQPRVNGYSGYEPIGYLQTVSDLSSFPSDAAIARLESLGVRYVVVDFPALARYRRGGPDPAYYRWEYPDVATRAAEIRDEIASRPELVLRADFGDVAIYELVR
jgi:hypothetical protein